MAQENPSLVPLKPSHVLLHGKVDSIRKYDGRVFTRLVLPAADSYSKPAMVEIESKQTLAQLEEEWRGQCVVGGYANDYDIRGEDGDKRKVRSARITLKAVE